MSYAPSLPPHHETCVAEWESRPRREWETPYHERGEHSTDPLSALDGALLIAAAGWPVFPCRGKRPMTRHGFKDATTDPKRIREWWHDAPDANIGVALPVGTLAVDVDDRYTFARSGLELPDAPEQVTPSGGLHRLYTIDGTARQTVKEHPGVDTRVGGKGYVVAWDRRAFSSSPSTLPPAPDWVR